jgi:hypothetical protein
MSGVMRDRAQLQFHDRSRARRVGELYWTFWPVVVMPAHCRVRIPTDPVTGHPAGGGGGAWSTFRSANQHTAVEDVLRPGI